MNAHIHAENMRLYAEDATKTDKPWELWEFISFGMEDYQTLESNPNWGFATEYRRKIKKANPLDAERASLYREFCEWCNTVPHLDLDPRLHTHGGRIEDGGYISNIAAAKAFAAWQAARRATAAPQPQADARDAELVAAVVYASTEAMNSSIESPSFDGTIILESHHAASLSLALDELEQHRAAIAASKEKAK